MDCSRCGRSVVETEVHEHLGRTLCEDCYMDALSPPRTCDPWAVHSAKSFGRDFAGRMDLTDRQQRILDLLRETGGATPAALAERLQITPADLEREIAALRHMEKVRGELREGVKVIRLW